MSNVDDEKKILLIKEDDVSVLLPEETDIGRLIERERYQQQDAKQEVENDDAE